MTLLKENLGAKTTKTRSKAIPIADNQQSHTLSLSSSQDELNNPLPPSPRNSALHAKAESKSVSE